MQGLGEKKATTDDKDQLLERLRTTSRNSLVNSVRYYLKRSEKKVGGRLRMQVSVESARL